MLTTLRFCGFLLFRQERNVGHPRKFFRKKEIENDRPLGNLRRFPTGKSYRLPYSSVLGVVRSCKWDKRIANRAIRRTQNSFVNNCSEWDEELIPHRYECAHNNVYGWNRDGNQSLQTIRHNDYNPFWIKPSYYSEEKAISNHKKRLARRLKWIEELSRK